MSAYIVSEKVINEIVNLIAGNGNVDVERHYGNIRIGKLCYAAADDGLVGFDEFPANALEFGDWNLEQRIKFISILGRALWGMNIKAVSQRYPNCVHATSVDENGNCSETGKHQLPGPVPNPNPHHYKYRSLPTKKKSAIGNYYSEYNYQCLEGDVPGTNLFKAIGVVVGGMAIEIITDEDRSRETSRMNQLDAAPVQIQLGM